jgi:hypothetical protein
LLGEARPREYFLNDQNLPFFPPEKPYGYTGRLRTKSYSMKRPRAPPSLRSRLLSLVTISVLFFMLLAPPVSLYYVMRSSSTWDAFAATTEPIRRPLAPPGGVAALEAKRGPPAPRLLPVPIIPEEMKFLNHAIVDEKHRLLVCAIP